MIFRAAYPRAPARSAPRGVVPPLHDTLLGYETIPPKISNKTHHRQQTVKTSLAIRLLNFYTKVGIIASLDECLAFIMISDYAYRLGSSYLMDAMKRLWRVYFYDPEHSSAANAATSLSQNIPMPLLLDLHYPFRKVLLYPF